jgi:NAD(P)-dependent dehydrogenase (short-subunit alcohol dehydrogenase family)
VCVRAQDAKTVVQMVAKEGAHAIALAGTQRSSSAGAPPATSSHTHTHLLTWHPPGDVSTEEFAADAVDKALNAFGRIDILVNNAGCQRLCDRLADCSAKQLRHTFEVNVFSACAQRRDAAICAPGGVVCVRACVRNAECDAHCH